ncbi:MAG TPA: DUF1841 family protein [Burkholderiaceae bacterium]|nr:DUF1841 family protein [Burkholderiaceae bacterium]
MFNPNRDEVRQFFIETWRKSQANEILTPLETIAADWMREHPEYEPEFVADALARDYSIDQGRTNPFLHLAMHLSLTEQISIDQPKGIRAAIDALAARRGSLHDAHHDAMECLGEMLWTAQRSGQPPDGLAYVECVRRRAGLRG